jgi:hypothetical protein
LGEDNESHSVSEKKFICQQEIMKTLIKNGRIVTAVDDNRADILIEDERISVFGKDFASHQNLAIIAKL